MIVRRTKGRTVSGADSQTCKDCGEPKALSRDFFGQYKTVKNGVPQIGFRSTCRRCMAARSARHASENPEQKRAAGRRRAERASEADSSIIGFDGRALRQILGDACRYCCDPLGGAGEFDHLTPVARGGSGGDSNITLACSPCNRAKLAKTLDEFVAWRRERGLPVRNIQIPGEQPDEPTSTRQRRAYRNT